MELNIGTNNLKGVPLFDTDGNLYIKFNGNYYDIIIQGNNTLLCEKIKLNQIIKSKNIKSGQFKLTSSMNSLKGKVFKEYLKDMDKLKTEDYEIEETEDEFDRINKFFPEDFEYFESYDKSDNIDDEKEEYFIFLSDVSKNNILNIIEGNDGIALYESLLYNKDLSSGDLIFKSKLINGVPIYRLRLYESGDIAFRPIGDQEQYYKLLMDENNNLILKSIKFDIKEDNKEDTEIPKTTKLINNIIELGTNITL
jgi:hypothetical protein